MIDRVVVDTGPLVAIVRKRDANHSKCVAALKQIRPPLITCWPVLTEAAWLLKSEHGGIKALDNLIQSGVVQIAQLDQGALHWIVAFLDRYASIDPQMADAALMLIAERKNIAAVFTLDRRDFWVYRTTNGRALKITPEVF